MADNNAIGMMIKQIHDALLKNANNALRGEDLTLTQVGVLATLYDAENYEMPLKELERAHHVSQPTAHGIVKRLFEKGFVDTFDDADNRRMKRVRLTTAGKKQAARARLHMNEAEEMLTQNLSDKERVQLKRMLNKVRQGLL